MNTNGIITVMLPSVTICTLFRSRELLSVPCLKVENYRLVNGEMVISTLVITEYASFVTVIPKW
jgi:hypothetical protein